jgi:hypothetical protein
MTPNSEIPLDQFVLGLVNSLDQRAALLKASAGLVADGDDLRDTHVRSLLERGGEIARACAALGRQANPTALGLLARVHLEDLIRLHWVTMSVKNAESLHEAGIDGVIRVANVNMQSGKLQVLDERSGEDVTAQIAADKRMKTVQRRKNVEACATEAGVLDLYNVFYRFMSLETHGHRLDSSNRKSGLELTSMHLQGIGGITQALGHAGARGLVHRQRPTNEELWGLLGLGGTRTKAPPPG